MHEIKQQNYFQAVRQEDTTWPAYELRWPCYNYVIAEQPTGHLAAIWKNRKHSLVPDLERDQRGKIHRIARVKSVAWPEGGMFVPEEYLMLPTKARAVKLKDPQPRGWYHPVNEGPAILLDVQRTSPQDPKALLKFVNKWGSLGIGISEKDDFLFQGVLDTGKCLEAISQWIQTYQALQRKKKVNSSFGDLAYLLSGRLRNIQPAVCATKKGFDPIFRVSRLIDAMWLECWEMVTTGKQLLRCPECRAYFLPGRANQMYCNRRCAIRPTVRNAKAKKKREENANP